MISEAEIIDQPDSGEFEERIYDIESPWNSQNWTWIRFKDGSNYCWCGQFRGASRSVSVSELYGKALVLTSDYLFEIELISGNILNYEDRPGYRNLTTAPDGSFIVADYYSIERITLSIKDKEYIKSPFEMDMIQFKDWKDGVLEFTCDEFLNSKREDVSMIYDYKTNNIAAKDNANE